jgi:hypothetical protein
MTYRHDGDKYEVSVGKPRKIFKRQTGPRGGYLKNADWQGWGTETGSVVTAIEDGGKAIYVFSEEPSGVWANPSMVGFNEIVNIDWINEASGQQADG